MSKPATFQPDLSKIILILLAFTTTATLIYWALYLGLMIHAEGCSGMTWDECNLQCKCAWCHHIKRSMDNDDMDCGCMNFGDPNYDCIISPDNFEIVAGLFLSNILFYVVIFLLILMFASFFYLKKRLMARQYEPLDISMTSTRTVQDL